MCSPCIDGGRVLWQRDANDVPFAVQQLERDPDRREGLEWKFVNKPSNAAPCSFVVNRPTVISTESESARVM